MPSPLKEWRRNRRDTGFWLRARNRSASLREAEIVSELDVAVMTMGQSISRYRQMSGDREIQLDQLRELRLQMEICLGMLENIIPD